MKQLLNGHNLKNSLISGYHNLANARYYLNEINVFPIPDGDTGTNLYLTLKSGIANIKHKKTSFVHEILQLFVSGLLMGSRGNSGVIFSQIFRGFLKPIPADLQVLDNVMLVRCFQVGRKEAYESVMKPIEGTMLSIIRAISTETKSMKRINDVSPLTFFERVISIGKKTVAKTQSLLSEAKKNNCVDAGALGFCVFLEGMAFYLKRGMIVKKSDSNLMTKKNFQPIPVRSDVFGYCTELVIQLNDRYQVNFNLPRVRKVLTAQKVDSIVTGLDNDLLKIHGHTLRPGLMINVLQTYGEFKQVKVENMSTQYREMLKHKASFNNEITTYRHINGILLVVANVKLKKFFQDEFKINNFIVTQHLTANQLKCKLQEMKTKNVFILSHSAHDATVIKNVDKENGHFTLSLLPTIGPAAQFLTLIYFFPGEKLKKNIDRMQKQLKKHKVIMIKKQPSPSQGYLCYFNLKLVNTWANETDFTKLTTAILKKYIIVGECEIVTLFYNSIVDARFVKWVKTILRDEFEVEVTAVDAGKIDHTLAICIE